MSAYETIISALDDDSTHDEAAQRVLDALSAGGFAVVELPKPNVDLEFESGMVVARPGFDRVRLYVEDDRLTAQDAHDLGCELIAASILSSRPAADRAGDDGEGR